MTKIYEALEHAKKSKLKPREAEPKERRKVFRDLSDGYTPTPISGKLNLERSLATLYQNMGIILPDLPCRIIQFISARPHEGTMEICREFAKLCAFKYKKKTLLLDILPSPESQMSYYNFPVSVGWNEAINNESAIRETIHRVEETELYVSTVIGNDRTISLDPDSRGLNDVFDELRQEYKFIIVDSSSTIHTTDTLLLSRKIDGVILVVEAEKTRWQVADKVKNKLLAQEANILGVVLNKRRFPIPDFIYKYL